jgi:predicted PurR-regulated permease PerM
MKPNHLVGISTGTFLKAVLTGLAIWFLWYIREVVAIFFVSLLLAALIDPFADWFSKRNIPRGLSVLIVYTVLLTLVVLVVVGIIPIIADQFAQLISNLSNFSDRITDTLARVQSFSARHGLSENISSSLTAFEQGINQSANSLLTTVKGFFGGIATLFIVLVLTFYMVTEGEKMNKYFKSLAPVEYQPFIAEILNKMQIKIGAWLRGQLLLGFVIGVVTFIGLSILGVRYALLLAIIAGLFELIPYIGPIFSAIPAVIIALAQTPWLAIAVVILYLIIQQMENNFLVPKIMQKVTGLNPIISIIAFLIGLKVGGIVGAIFAIPLATILMVLVEDMFHEYT